MRGAAVTPVALGRRPSRANRHRAAQPLAAGARARTTRPGLARIATRGGYRRALPGPYSETCRCFPAQGSFAGRHWGVIVTGVDMVAEAIGKGFRMLVSACRCGSHRGLRAAPVWAELRRESAGAGVSNRLEFCIGLSTTCDGSCG